MTRIATSSTTQANMLRIFEYLRSNPWKTRKEIGDALGMCDDTTRRLFTHLDLKKRVRKPNKIRPLEYAMHDVPPNPYRKQTNG